MSLLHADNRASLIIEWNMKKSLYGLYCISVQWTLQLRYYYLFVHAFHFIHAWMSSSIIAFCQAIWHFRFQRRRPESWTEWTLEIYGFRTAWNHFHNHHLNPPLVQFESQSENLKLILLSIFETWVWGRRSNKSYVNCSITIRKRA